MAWALLVVAVALLAGCLIRYFIYVASLLSYPYEWDEDEGLGIYFARQLLAHQPIYVSVNRLPMLSGCYPPVYYLVLCPFVRILGASLPVARLLSVGATVLFCVASAALVWQETRHWRLGLLAVLLVVGSPAVCVWSPLARIDSLALALGLTGLFLVRQRKWPRGGVLLGVVLLLLATFTRYQSALLVPPVLWYLWRTCRWTGLAATGAYAVGVAAIFIGLTHFSAHFWQSTVVVQAAGFDLAQLGQRLAWFLMRHAVIVLGMCAWVVASVRRRNSNLWMSLALMAIPMELLLGKVGASINYNMPVVAIGAICTILILHDQLAQSPHRWFGVSGCLGMALIVVQGLLYWMDPVPSPGPKDRETNEALVEVMKRTAGPVLTERRTMLGILSGHDPQIDICTLFFAYQIGRDSDSPDRPDSSGKVCWDPAGLTAAVNQQRYALILLDNPSLFPTEVVTAIHRNYRRLNTQPIVVSSWHGTNRYDLATPIWTASTASAPATP